MTASTAVSGGKPRTCTPTDLSVCKAMSRESSFCMQLSVVPSGWRTTLIVSKGSMTNTGTPAHRFLEVVSSTQDEQSVEDFSLLSSTANGVYEPPCSSNSLHEHEHITKLQPLQQPLKLGARCDTAITSLCHNNST